MRCRRGRKKRGTDDGEKDDRGGRGADGRGRSWRRLG